MLSRVVFLIFCIVVVPCSATLDFARVHLVDFAKTDTGLVNFLFRSNMPINDTTLDYDNLKADMKFRVQNESGVAGLELPDAFYLLDISLDNPFDKDNAIELSFWNDPLHASLGSYLNWPIGFAGILPPTLYTTQQIIDMSAANGTVWNEDHLPDRVDEVRQMLLSPHASGLPLVILVHCEAGCDRTGQMVGSYRLRYQQKTAKEMYALDVYECTRPPNYFSTSGLEWFCYYLQYHQGFIQLGDCAGFATCQPFGDCTPTMAKKQQQ